MVETSWANHYKIGYNNYWFTFRESPLDRLDIFDDGCSRKPMSFAMEAVNTASIIAEKYGADNLCLFYSGGGDSEIVMNSFIGLGKYPRKIVFLNYGSNKYDQVNAVAYAKYYQIPIEVVNLDTEELLRSGESLEICNRYQCGQVGLSFYLKAIETYCKDYYVITGDDPYIERMHNPLTHTDDWFFFAREPFYALWKIFIKNNVDGCPNFIQYSPELFTSFWDDPIMQWLINDQTELNCSNQVKGDIYRHRFFIKPRYKSTGMETFAHLVYEQNQALLIKYPDITNQELKLPFNDLYHQLTRFIK